MRVYHRIILLNPRQRAIACCYRSRGKGLRGRVVQTHSYADIAQGEDLRGVFAELCAIVDDTLADGLKILDLAVPEVGEQLSETVDILLLLLTFVVTVGSQLEENLVICNRAFRQYLPALCSQVPSH